MKNLLLLSALLLCPPASAEPVSERITWLLDGTTAAATVTLPEGSGPWPGVVLVPGSGPTDRDWNSPLLPGRNGSAALLADAIAKAGFAVIRYDKRFTGPYAAANGPLLSGKLSLRSHMEEVSSAAAELKKRPGVAADKIFALTNSEGAVHALNAHLAGEPEFAGLILTGAPGRSMGALLRGQIEAQVSPLPQGKEIMAGYDKLVARFQAGLPFAPEPAVPQAINNMVAGFYVPANLPFMREFLSADPARLAAGVKAPVLLVIGGKDMQVDRRLDGAPLEKALAGNKSASFAYPADADHLLKHEPKPREQLVPLLVQNNYNAAGRELDGEALKVIIDWLRSRSAPELKK
ncbi:MAG TPA: alpha/beta hydrolase [Elusimicrobia bacterium]|nr:alpha/beta hydrolase [Elusimicrobiota bacterium]HAU89693.1 alpha/beta hydrolase [Elusimicrobiota bacterium]